MRRLGLALRLLRRNAHAGEARVLLLALFIAVASVTTVGFFADRVAAALNQQANELLGGDLVVISDHPTPPAYTESAAKAELEVAQTRTFPSMVSVEGGVNLAEIKAVGPGFPLRGKIRIADVPGGEEREVEGGPPAGSAWIGVPLAGRLNLKVGDTVKVGRANLKVGAIIAREPDSVLDYFGIAPRLLMNAADVESTGLITVGSRVTYRLLVKGEAAAVDRFRADITPNLQRGQRVETVRDARSEVRVSLERASRFLGLASLLSVVLASVAVALAARRFSQRQTDAAAMMRCLGASQADIFVLHAWQFLALGAAACVLGTAAGYGAQAILARWLTVFFTVALPLPGPQPALQGALTGFTLLLGFTLPPLLRLRNASTLRVLRRDMPAAEPMSLAAFALGLVALGALILWQAGDVKLGGIALAGFALALVAAAVGGYILIRLVSRVRGAASGPWRYGLANLRRRTGASLVQIMALGLGLMAMMLLLLVRTDLLAQWQRSMPADMPNRFALNIQTDQLPEVRSYFEGLKLATPDLHPMVRGRLIAINGTPVAGATFKEPRARRLAEREFNLSYTDQLPPDNKVTAGRMWAAGDATPQFTVEDGIAVTLGIKLGDELQWEVAGSKFTAKVTSLRKVDWDSFRANFFVVANPALLKAYPASWITSFHLPRGREEVVTGLVRKLPNVSVIDLSAIMEQVVRVSNQVSKAVEFVFLFTLAAGLVVLFAAITSTQDERVFEGAIMRTLGASRRQMTVLQLAEFLAIGLLSGFIAAAGAVSLTMVLADRVLNVPYEVAWFVPIAGIFGGTLVVALAGLLGTRQAVSSPPLQTIRAVT